MDQVRCVSCKRNVVPDPPRRRYWALIATFWVFSLLFGIGAAWGGGWGLVLLVAWLLLATTMGVLVRHAAVHTCSACGATLPPPARGSPRPAHAA